MVINKKQQNYLSLCESKEKTALRVAVAHTDSSHTGKQIQIPLPVYIPKPLHVSLVDEHWFLIVCNLHDHGVAVLSADLYHLLFGHTLGSRKTHKHRTEYKMFVFLFSFKPSL